MKYKKSIILLMMVIFFLSIASVCASDSNNTALSNVDKQPTVTSTEKITDIYKSKSENSASDESQILSSSKSNERLGDSTTVTNHTFEAIRSAIDEGNNIIYLEPGTYTGNAIYMEGKNNITIIGNSTILDAEGKDQILFILRSNDIKLQGITFANGNYDSGGAIIGTELENLQIINCIFTNNTASAGGGAIALAMCPGGQIINTTFTNNKADSCGAIVFDFSNNIIIEGNIFKNNSANSLGIINAEDSNGQITSNIFINNSVESIIDIGISSSDYITINNNIFLNNNGIPIKLLATNSNVDYNWFGHDQSNYKNNPDIAFCTKWLFLNTTAIPNTITVSDTSNITFEIFSYDSQNNYITTYDKNLLKDIIMTITATNGNVSSSTAKFGDIIKFTATKAGTGSVKASIDNATYTINLKVNKGSPNLSIVDAEVPYAENITLTLNYNSEATGKVNITLKGKKHNLTFKDMTLNSTLKLENVLPDEYNITVTYSGDKSFLNATASGKLTVLKIDSNIKVESHDINVTESDGIMFTITLPKDATGNLKISNGETIDVVKKGKVEKGKLVIKIKNNEYPVGKYNWTFNYLGDDIYKNSTDQATSNILIVQTEIEISNTTLELKVLHNASSGATLNPAKAGNLTYTSSNSSVVIINKGMIIPIAQGKAIITVSFDGNDKYAAAENKTISVTVSMNDARVYVDNTTLNLKIDDTYSINATTVPQILKLINITYTSSNVSVVSVDKNGIVTAIGEGNATITVIVGDDHVFAKNSTEIFVSVSKLPTKIEASSVTTAYNIDNYLTINVKDINGKPVSGVDVTVDLNGVKTYTTDNNGQIMVPTKDLVPKTYTAQITFNGNSKYIKSTNAVEVVVIKATPKLTAKNKKFKKTKKVKKYPVILKTNTNKAMQKVKVTLKIKGQKTITAKTNSKGKAIFKIKKLTKKGKYKAAVKFKGNKYYNKVSKKVKIILK